jgi:hypothetical protein
MGSLAEIVYNVNGPADISNGKEDIPVRWRIYRYAVGIEE